MAQTVRIVVRMLSYPLKGNSYHVMSNGPILLESVLYPEEVFI